MEAASSEQISRGVLYQIFDLGPSRRPDKSLGQVALPPIVAPRRQVEQDDGEEEEEEGGWGGGKVWFIV